MNQVAYFFAWEWINIALEYTAVSWTRLPHLFWSIVGINLVTHPILVLLIEKFGRAMAFVLPCEVAIVGVEALLLMAIYGFRRWRKMLGISLLMNATSYVTGLLI